MNKPSSVSATLALVEEYRNTVAGFAAREQSLTGDHRTALYQAKRKRDLAVQGEEQRHAAGLATADEEFRDARQRLEQHTTGREDRLNEAWYNSEKRLAEQLEHIRGNKILGLQHHILQARRQLRSDLEAARDKQRELNGELEADRASLEALCRATSRALGGFFGLPKIARGGAAEPLPPAAGSAGEADGSAEAEGPESPPPSPAPAELRAQAHAAMDEAGAALTDLNRLRPVAVFRWLPPWVLLPVAAVLLGAWNISRTGGSGWLLPTAIALAVLAAVVAVMHSSAAKSARPFARKTGALATHARSLLAAAEASAAAEVESLRSRLSEGVDHEQEASGEEWKEAVRIAEIEHAAGLERLNLKWKRALARNDSRHAERLAALTREYDALVAMQKENSRDSVARFESGYLQTTGELETARRTNHEKMVADWRSTIEPLWQRIEAHRAAGDALFPPWPEVDLDALPPRDGTAATAARFGELAIDLEALAGPPPADPQLPLPGPARFRVPLTLAFPDGGNIVLESSGDDRDAAIATLNSLVFRLLAGTPPGRMKLTLIDPVGLGQSFAGLSHLADYENSVLSHRIWTQREQIEKRLSDLNEHVEKVIQMYLRDDFETIADYNEHAGNIAEKFHFVVIADFPAAFSDLAMKRLQSLVATGPRCGVFTFLHRDLRQVPGDSAVIDDLHRPAAVVRIDGGQAVLAGGFETGTAVTLDTPPAGERASAFIHRTGRESLDSSRVEVPFTAVAPADDRLWQAATIPELRVPIGRTGASKFQQLALGKGTRQHALFAGKTGSGKSNLFHVIVTNLALHCSPHEVEFYLVDFKKGVEFKCYGTHRLPHARVVAIESDREFGLSVLQRVDDELRRRGDRFRSLGVQDLEGARAATTDPIPRSLLIIDEFQEFFTEDDRISQNASVLLDRIVRQGRAFGIHVLLGSQTLGGAYSLARATLGQMVVRVALQCNEADAMLIMDDGNSAPRLLSRPGEGIYNDAGGAVEGNSPFQAVFLPERVRDEYLAKIDRLSREHPEFAALEPVVFEGNAPAEIADNAELRRIVQSPAAVPAPAPRIWLGAPNSIKGPTEAVFHRQTGNHLLIVGQRDEAILTMLGLGAVALAAQHPHGGARLIAFDGSVPGTSERTFVDRLADRLSGILEVARGSAIPDVMKDLSDELARRSTSGGIDDPPVFLLIHGLQRHRKLRPEDEFSFSSGDEAETPGAQFERLIREGAAAGIHLIVTVDAGNNLLRAVSRKSLSEFEMRVLFQMSAADSASLIDSPAAGNLGMHRAILHDEHEGYEEVFRPYGPPDDSWWDNATRPLNERGAPAVH